MTQRIICIYHANCADGFTAAWAVREALGPEVEFIPASYGSEPPEAKDADVILVDFSYKRDVLEALAERAKSVLVLDHHKTAAENLASFPAAEMLPHDDNWRTHLELVEDNLYAGMPAVIFDMERSGAQLAWDFFHGSDADNPRPKLVDYVADRDLWRFELEHSRAIAAAVFSRPFDFPTWNEIAVDMEDQSGFDVLATEGYAIERKQKKDIADLLKATRREMTIGGHRVPVANVPYLMASDAGHIMAEGQPFAATYTDGADGQRRFSLRSYPGAEDVSKIAASYGGGGHARAAGFQMPIGWKGDDAPAAAPVVVSNDTSAWQMALENIARMVEQGFVSMDGSQAAAEIRSLAPRADLAPTGNAALVEALAEAKNWHESQDRALSKQPPSGAGEWMRLQHREQIQVIDAALAKRTEGQANG